MAIRNWFRTTTAAFFAAFSLSGFAFAQAQSPTCAKASLLRATRDPRTQQEALALAEQCRKERAAAPRVTVAPRVVPSPVAPRPNPRSVASRSPLEEVAAARAAERERIREQRRRAIQEQRAAQAEQYLERRRPPANSRQLSAGYSATSPQFIGNPAPPPISQPAPMATQASSARGRLAETPNLANQPAWVAYLPATDRVTAAFGVEDNGGSAVRQEAAFAVLCDFIEALTSTSSSTVAAMPTGAQLFWYRYNASQRGVAPTPPNAQTGPLSSDANTLFMDSGFRSEVLAAFFPPFLQVMYLATPNAQRASEHVDGSTQPKTQVPIKKWLGADVSAAKAKGVDLTVFGIPVGGHWEVPDCPAQDSATGPTCRIGAVTPIAVKRGSMARAMDSMLAHPLSRSSAPWVTHHVLLAPDRRTEWVSDTLAVVVLDEQILGVSAQVSGSADIQAVETQLREKYHAAPKVIANSECSTQPGVAPAASTHDREWSLPGLHVYYRPVAKGFGCAAGHITVESDALHRLREQTVRDHEAHRPKM